jgi:hypothetical protein
MSASTVETSGEQDPSSLRTNPEVKVPVVILDSSDTSDLPMNIDGVVQAETLVEPLTYNDRLARRLELFKEDPHIVAEQFGKRLAEEFEGYLSGDTHSFRAYFVLCPEIHGDKTDSAEIHALSHDYFLSDLGLNREDITSVATDDEGTANIQFDGRKDAVLSAQFLYMPDASEPFAVNYRAERTALQRGVMMARTALSSLMSSENNR